MRDNLGLTYEALKEDDPEWKNDDMRASICFRSDSGMQVASNFIKVPFKDALGLVARRQVFISKGTAFVPMGELNSIASNQFRARLAQELMKAYKVLPMILKDLRVQSMLIALGNHNAIDFNIFEAKAPEAGDKIRLQDLDYHCRKSFPPCMK
jgi:DNA primase large subunit